MLRLTKRQAKNVRNPNAVLALKPVWPGWFKPWWKWMLVSVAVTAFLSGYIWSASWVEASSQTRSTPVPEEVQASVFDDRPKGVLWDTDLMRRYIEDQNSTVYPELAETILVTTIAASEKYAIPPAFILLLMKIESEYKYNAVSNAGAIGLMQVNPEVWVGPDKLVKKKKDLYDPKKNIMAGTAILRTYLDEGLTKGVANPMLYAVTRYLGGTKNDHYRNLCTAIGEYYVFANCELGFARSGKVARVETEGRPKS